jgi:metallophosphoesterase (TIGR03767 family)
VTTERTIRGGPASARGYRTLRHGPGEEVVVRTDLGQAGDVLGKPLITIAHLSDLHVCDAQSPARAEFLDRWADPDSPVRDDLDEVGCYRAQELLTAQVAEAMVSAVNEAAVGPVTRFPIDLAIVTGDNTDNAQANELAWYVALLEGGDVCPDSGDRARWEGVGGLSPDERFWHPETAGLDLPQLRYGFPAVPALTDAARAPFRAAGLDMPWLAVHGNHDRLVQGTVPGAGGLDAVAVGAVKAIAVPDHWTNDVIIDVAVGLERCDPAALATLMREVRTQPVTADPGRRLISRQEFVDAHFGAAARPAGHGFTSSNRAAGTTYYRHDSGRVTMLMLDTVNEHGGWQGSLDADQLAWLDSELMAADADRRYAVLASHHPLHTLVNDATGPASPPRVLADQLDRVIAAHPSVVLWLNGHTHHTTVRPHGTWWEVTAPSLIDWPQQGRVVELLHGRDGLTVATTMLDHAGPAPWDGSIDSPHALAGLSRELSANHWQEREHSLEQHPRSGTAADRNVLLHLPDPWAAIPR